MPIVTVLTPTYNRADKLPALYASLCSQTSMDFAWLIVDDGSTDDTRQIVEEFGQAAGFSITYLYKANGGKHTALNTGLQQISTLLTIIVDSDDMLLPQAVQLIAAYARKYAGETGLSGFSFLRVQSDGVPIVPLDVEEFRANYIDYRIRQSRPGDMAEVFYTDILRQYPFPQFAGERFLSEDVVWIEMGKQYDYIFVNQPIYRCEYLAGGLTANDKPMKFASPLGSMLRGIQMMTPACGLKANIKGAIIYNCYRKAAPSVKDLRLKLDFRRRLLTLITWPLGHVYYKKWRSQ